MAASRRSAVGPVVRGTRYALEDVRDTVHVEGGERSNIDATLAAYEHGVDEYIAASPAAPSEAYARFRASIMDLLPPNAHMLEVGTGPGHDAAFFETKGFVVQRTDATAAFVARLRRSGHSALFLDVTTDDFGGPFDVVFANAVFVHLTTSQFGDALERAAQAVTPTGLLAFTVKEGDGEAWTTAKLAQPRYFRYWRQAALEDKLAHAGWTPLSIDPVQGRLEPWLYAICRRAARS